MLIIFSVNVAELVTVGAADFLTQTFEMTGYDPVLDCSHSPRYGPFATNLLDVHVADSTRW